jgi:hypothetical protein
MLRYALLLSRSRAGQHLAAAPKSIWRRDLQSHAGERAGPGVQASIVLVFAAERLHPRSLISIAILPAAVGLSLFSSPSDQLTHYS